MNRGNIIEVFDLYRNYGENGYIGEEVTQLQHATRNTQHKQMFWYKKYKDNHEIILCAFLHDIGHFI